MPKQLTIDNWDSKDWLLDNLETLIDKVHKSDLTKLTTVNKCDIVRMTLSIGIIVDKSQQE